jgi:hypothetical protein
MRTRFQFRRIQIMADKLMKIPGPDHPISIHANPSRVVVRVGGKVIADTRDALTLREASYPAVQYIPRRDVDMAALKRSEHTTYCPYKGKGRLEAPARRLGQLRQNRWRVHRAELRAVDSHQAVPVEETLRMHVRISQRRQRRAQNLLKQFHWQQLSALGVGRIAHLYPVQSAAIGGQCAALLQLMVDQSADQLRCRQLRGAARSRTVLLAHLLEHRRRNQTIQHIQELHALHADTFAAVINCVSLPSYVVDVEILYALTALRLARLFCNSRRAHWKGFVNAAKRDRSGYSTRPTSNPINKRSSNGCLSRSSAESSRFTISRSSNESAVESSPSKRFFAGAIRRAD